MPGALRGSADSEKPSVGGERTKHYSQPVVERVRESNIQVLSLPLTARMGVGWARRLACKLNMDSRENLGDSTISDREQSIM